MHLKLADWLEELAVFGNPRDMLAPETAHHLCQVLRHAYLVRLAIRKPSAAAQKASVALQNLDGYLRARTRTPEKRN